MIRDEDINNNLNIDSFDLDKILNECKIDTSIDIVEPPAILLIKEITTVVKIRRLFTIGNFSTIIGKAKGRKTFLETLFFSSILKGSDSSEKLKGSLPEGKTLLVYFDTEQGLFDSITVMRRIELMAGDSKNDFVAYNLRPYTPAQRCEIVEYFFKFHGKKTGFCVIDGIADLATGINNEDEATRVVSMLLRITSVYNTHISVVIHQNKNDNYATGHLGSYIMKKSEIVISVNKTKCKTGSDVKCEYSRGIDFDDFIIRINEEGMPEISSEILNEKDATPF